jgi:hypothetical protein
MIRATKWLIVCCALLMLSGCNVGGAAMRVIQGPEVHHAQYEPKKEMMAVLVENYAKGSGGHLDADQVAAFLCAELRNNNVAPVVDPAKVYELRVDDPAKFHAMSIAAVGRAVGAEQVLYVDIQSLTVDGPAGSETMKGALAARVKIVDVKTGDSRWPAESTGGYPVEYETPWLNQAPEVNANTVEEKLDRSVADSLARLFYTWKDPE